MALYFKCQIYKIALLQTVFGKLESIIFKNWIYIKTFSYVLDCGLRKEFLCFCEECFLPSDAQHLKVFRFSFLFPPQG